ncbi:unnamed protein product [Bursaphelenchus okinawaensis]|uniref:RING-type domain-containing protein n=1 Tax=Bursaphelenchus okinawaensis TaxID=465554 RepID=A0A811KPT7_9BILA|nr:unnamed protein product [Bursaphelenchus okinawaensis]CAG9107060.1 unnamed protein product [Bursaphelenchus okinawaensis]
MNAGTALKSPTDTSTCTIDALKCNLCDGLLFNPVVVKTCSHRFCESCMHRYRRAHNRTCPSCTRWLVTADGVENFEKDELFQRIVNSLTGAKPLLNGIHKEKCNDILSPKRKKSSDIDNDVLLVLWPDISVRRLPKSANRVRYIMVSGDTTIAHLSEFIKIRTKMESKASSPRLNDILVQFTPIIFDQPDYSPCQLPSTAKIYHENELSSVDDDDEDDSIHDRFRLPNQMIAIEYPFRPLPSDMTLAEAKEIYYLNRRKTFKLMFRIISNEEVT